MARKTTLMVIFVLSLIGAMTGAMFGASPAKAFCIVNQTSDTLYATHARFNPLADFDKTIKPGKKICCDWFDRRCNPTGTRGALVELVIEGQENRARWENAARMKVENRRRGRSVQGVLKALDIPTEFPALFCQSGRKRSVLASSGGTIVISKNTAMPGRLYCVSRDHFLRPVFARHKPDHKNRPLLVAPQLKRRSREIPTIHEQLSR